MKRHLCIVLILALFSLSISSYSLAEASEDICMAVDAPVAPADQAGDTGLIIDGADDGAQMMDEVVSPETLETPQAPAQPEEPSPYARVQSETATIFSDAEGTQVLGNVPLGCVVLVLSQEAVTRAALYTQRGVIVGYMDTACLARLDNAEHTAYMDAAAGMTVALYENDLNLPLTFVECAFADAAQSDTAEAAVSSEPAIAQYEPEPVMDANDGSVEQAPGEDAAVLAPVPQTGEAFAEAPVAQDGTAVVATGLRLSAEAITIGVKEKYTGLTAIAVPEGSALPAISWRSDNTKYVKVNASTGKITGVKKGSAHVFAKIEGGAEVSCLVTVARAPGKIALSATKLTLGSGGMTAQLTWSLPKGGATNSVTFTSKKPSVATVDANGLVTSVGPGSATIVAKTHNGKTAKCKVKVVEAPASISFPSASISLAVGQTLSIDAVALGSSGKATKIAVSYIIDAASIDAGCIALDPENGTITGLHKGQATITAIAYNGVAASCPVSVCASPAAIQLSDASITLGAKQVYEGLQAQLIPPSDETECATGLVWSSSNKKIAKVDAATGKITGVKKGSCTITATTVNGLQATCSVKVFKAPRKIKLIPSKGTLEIGQTGQFKVKFPSGSGGSVIFATSDPNIATIDDDGVITAVAAGKVTVAARTYNGKIAKATLNVTKASVSLPVDEDFNVDSSTSEYDDGMTNAQKLEYMIYVAQTQKGKPYKYGGGYSKDANPSGFDCSGLVYWSFLHIGIRLEASAYRQGYDNSYSKITNAADLKRGDVVCFNTNGKDNDESDHTGIYLGNGKFIHASSSAKKVIVSTLASGYYSRAFSWGRRILP